MKKFESLDNVVIDILSSIGLDPSGRGYLQMSRIVLRTLNSLGYFVIPNKDSRIYKVEDNGTIPYPINAYKVIKAGLCLSDGSVAILGKVESSPIAKVLPDTCSCSACGGEASTNTVSVSPDVCTNSIFFNYIEGNTYIGELYGFKEEGFPHGRWYDNENESRIEFTSVVRPGSDIVLTYQTVVSKDTHKLIATEMYDMVRTKSLYHFFQASNPRKAQMFDQDYKRSVSLYKRLKEKHSYQEYVDALTSNYSNAAR